MSVSAAAVYQWTQGKRFPSDELMLVLGDLAGLLPDESLLLLSYWRSKGRSKNIYWKWLKVHGFHHMSDDEQHIGWWDERGRLTIDEVNRLTGIEPEQINI